MFALIKTISELRNPRCDYDNLKTVVTAEYLFQKEMDLNKDCSLTKFTALDSKDSHTTDSNQLTTISLRTVGSDPVCRICQDIGTRKNKLISPCRCSGSMGYFHVNCLEHWLSQSASNSCEVCYYEFRTVRKSKPISEWLRSPHSNRERRYIWADLACFLLLTPLGTVSSWLCVSGAWQYYQTGERWTGFGLIFLTSFLGLMYLLWAALTVRYHVQCFRKWRTDHQDVKLIIEASGLSLASLPAPISDDKVLNMEEMNDGQDLTQVDVV